MKNRDLLRNSEKSEVRDFIEKLDKMPVVRQTANRGRLIFAMDATQSREPTWERACRIQGRMFDVTNSLGGLDVQLCYYHGLEVFRASRWSNQASILLREMSAVRCLSGHTQIHKVLEHILAESKRQKVNAAVFIGDCMEENANQLYKLAGELGIRGIPLFIFHEGDEPNAASVFQRMAQLSHGAYCCFNSYSAQRLGELLGAVAVYAAGGQPALEDYANRHGAHLLQLTKQFKRD